MRPPRVALLGLAFDNLTLDAAAEMLLARGPEQPFAYVVTPNVDHLARLRKTAELAPIYHAAWLCLLDSQLIWNLAGLLKIPCPAVVTGADLTARLLDRLDGQPVAVVGLAAADMAALRGRYPNIVFLHHTPPMGLSRDPAGFARALEFAATVPAQFIFIALGSPLQERLAAAIATRRAGGIGLCIGAALGFSAGCARRAPRLMRHAGLEWLHRLAHDPLRLGRRYLLDDPPVLLALIRSAWRG